MKVVNAVVVLWVSTVWFTTVNALPFSMEAQLVSIIMMVGVTSSSLLVSNILTWGFFYVVTSNMSDADIACVKEVVKIAFGVGGA